MHFQKVFRTSSKEVITECHLSLADEQIVECRVIYPDWVSDCCGGVAIVE